ncbi:MAG: hypothetical protein KGL54_01500 [Sphingomonadales bacterium]|nr:hypothetical protein [Sphingomonadales bacterium]
MITTRPLPPAARLTARSRPKPAAAPPRPGDDQAWRLLAAGDEVSIAGLGAYAIIHLSQGRAWLAGLADGSNRLVETARLRLLHGHAGAGLARA